MEIVVNIIISDQTSEEKLVASGVTSKQLLELYTEGFRNILEGIATNETKTDLNIVVIDNTKEKEDRK